MNLLLNAQMRAAGLLLAVAAALGVAVPVHAERADRDQPMHIESDALRYESQQQRSTFTGNVVVTKGTIVMRGARLVVTQDGSGAQSAVMHAAPGKRAFFRQKRDGVDEYTEGEAQTIEYDGRKDQVHLVGNAEMRRLAGSQLQDKVTGAIIVYNNITEVYTVQSGGKQGDGDKQVTPGGRVRATLIPGGDSSGTGVPGDATPLQPSGKLAAPEGGR
ncbi:MAG: lipopolysaccharide transport periplasmic protein LptA [Candidatus Cloacimonetes bacterium]|nr:lipopolysaccharide transport periplasmic protein LptA [Candidatus Cloacimonadota bacterium]MCK9515582.1 lipopolysaccharide transport periplasmic protein LptA [Ottowia sp.]